MPSQKLRPVQKSAPRLFIEDFHNLEVSIEITQRWLHPVVVFTGADSPEPSLLV